MAEAKKDGRMGETPTVRSRTYWAMSYSRRQESFATTSRTPRTGKHGVFGLAFLRHFSEVCEETMTHLIFQLQGQCTGDAKLEKAIRRDFLELGVGI